jgi:hypothetical protein
MVILEWLIVDKSIVTETFLLVCLVLYMELCTTPHVVRNKWLFVKSMVIHSSPLDLLLIVDLESVSDCLDCPQGSTFNSTSNQCEHCKAGMWRNSSFQDCQPCPGGKFSNTSGVTACTLCAGGNYSVDGSTICSLCPNGTFSSEYGQSSCSICAGGYRNTQFTNTVGSDVTHCEICPPGRFSNSSMETYCHSCKSGYWSNVTGASSLSTCKPCAPFDGVWCAEGTTIPFVASGLYRTLSKPNDIASCIPAEACLAAEYGNTTCSEGYSELLCSLCTANYFRSGGKCVKCLNKAARWSLIVFSGVFILTAITKFSQSQNQVPPSLRLVLFWIQFLAVYPSLPNAWPTALFNFLRFTSVFNLDIGYLGIECDSGPNMYYTILSVKILLPFTFALLLLGLRGIPVLLKKSSRLVLLPVVSQSIFITNFLSIQLFSSMFQVFSCSSPGGDYSVISQQPSVRCGDETWKRFVVFDSFMIFFYCFVIPLAVIRIVRKALKENDTQVVSSLFRPMTSSYRSGAEYFELIRLLFRMSFVLIRDALPISSESKTLFYMLILLVLIWIESDTRPYLDRAQQGLSIMYVQPNFASYRSECLLGGRFFAF